MAKKNRRYLKTISDGSESVDPPSNKKEETMNTEMPQNHEDFLGMPIFIWGRTMFINALGISIAYFVLYSFSEDGFKQTCFVIPLVIAIGGAFFWLVDRIEKFFNL